MSRQRRLIAAGWRQYAEHVLPQNAPRVQMVQCRRAFYAGAIGLFEALIDVVGTDDPRISDAARLDVLRAVSDEAVRFHEDVREGRA